MLISNNKAAWLGQHRSPTDFGETHVIGRLLFRDFLLPFEVTSVLILIAIMGAVVLARGEEETELMVPLSWYLILSAMLFCLGVLGFLLKRNIITIFMSIELMLNAVNLLIRRLLRDAAGTQVERPDLCLLRDGGSRG